MPCVFLAHYALLLTLLTLEWTGLRVHWMKPQSTFSILPRIADPVHWAQVDRGVHIYIYILCLNGSDATMHLHQDIWKKNGKHWAPPQWVHCIIELHKALLETIASGEWILRYSRPLPHGTVKHWKCDLSEWSCCIVSIKYIHISKALYEKMPSISHWLLIVIIYWSYIFNMRS